MTGNVCNGNEANVTSGFGFGSAAAAADFALPTTTTSRMAA